MTFDAIPSSVRQVSATPAAMAPSVRLLTAEEEAEGYVRQRANNDCTIAATASVLRVSYEGAAEMLGVPCHPDTGLPQGLGGGVPILGIPAALIQRGIWTSPLFFEGMSDYAVHARSIVSLEQAKPVLARYPAVILALDTPFDRSVCHALAWRDGRAVDCRRMRVHELEAVSPMAAILIQIPEGEMRQVEPPAAEGHAMKASVAQERLSEHI